jgi:anti-anti-sigma regulatory factor
LATRAIVRGILTIVPKGSGRKAHKSVESEGDRSAADGAVVLAAVADMAAARDVTEALRSALERQAPVVIDAAAVEEMSTPCAQALASAAASFAGANVALAFRQPSDAFIAAFSRIGLYAAMMQWSFVE